MRDKFSETIFKNIKLNKKIFVVAADISPSGKMAKYQKDNENFINVGVSEQTMIGICAGLAMSGLRPFAYTIATFALYRPFEMIRDDICYQNLPVTIVGMGAGTIYANLGGTHTATEDISIARSLPNMQILSPCDLDELEQCINFCCKKNRSPTYLRIGKSGEKNLTTNAIEKWQFGKIRKITNGDEICIVSHGPITEIAFEIKKKINKNISIYSCHTIKPFDEKTIKKIFKKYKIIITIEDHSIIGGLSDIIKSLAFENKFQGKIIFNSLKDQFKHVYSSQKDLMKAHGISSEIIIKKIKNIIQLR
jgi:transketolase